MNQFVEACKVLYGKHGTTVSVCNSMTWLHAKYASKFLVMGFIYMIVSMIYINIIYFILPVK